MSRALLPAALLLAACGTAPQPAAPVQALPAVHPADKRPVLLADSARPLHAGDSGENVRNFLSGMKLAGCSVTAGADTLGQGEMKAIHDLQKRANITNETENIGSATGNVLHDAALYNDKSCGATFNTDNLLPGCWGVYDAQTKRLVSDGRLVVSAGPIAANNIAKCLSAPEVAELHAAKAHHGAKG